MSRRASRSAMSRRRSWSCLPRARPSSSLALPRVRYIRSGTIVWPFCLGATEQLVDLARGGAAASGSASARGCSGCRLLERRDVGADQPRLALLDPGIGVRDVDLAGADRLDLGAGQGDARLERLVDRELVAGSSVEGDGRARWIEGMEVAVVGGPVLDCARTPALCGPAFELLTHPQGVRLDGHLLRGGAATRTVDHCTSPPFVPRNRTRRGAMCARRVGASVARHPSATQCRRAGRAPRPARPAPRSSVGSVPGAASAGSADGDVRVDADVVDPALVRRQPACAIVRRNAPPSPGSSLPLLDRALAERASVRRASPGPCPGARPPRSRSPTRCPHR